MVHVREERPDDYAAIRALNDAAFGQPQEGLLVDALRMNGGVMLSLVAEQDGLVVGHILYSPATIDTEGRRVAGASLGPMAVLPTYQRRGVGGQLIEAGTRWLKRRGCPFVIVLGHPGYYPRFGFIPASVYGIHCEWEVPDEAFMVMLLDAPAMRDVSGMVRYRQEFSTVV